MAAIGPLVIARGAVAAADGSGGHGPGDGVARWTSAGGGGRDVLAGRRSRAGGGSRSQSMMLAAADLGIGAGHSAVGDQQQAQRVLGFPDGFRAVYLIGLGYPADRPLRPISRPDRRPFDEIVHWNHW
jgi:nitroreductase